jgi:hypothetical protein
MFRAFLTRIGLGFAVMIVAAALIGGGALLSKYQPYLLHGITFTMLAFILAFLIGCGISQKWKDWYGSAAVLANSRHATQADEAAVTTADIEGTGHRTYSGPRPFTDE